MKEDFLQQIESLGFTARLKRLSDILVYSAREHYKNIDLDIDPNWHLVFLLLKENGQLTVTEIASKLGFSHPGVIKIVKKMKESYYLESITDKKDSRKQQLQLSEKALNNLPKFEKEWSNIQQVIEEVIDEEFYENLARIENRLKEASFIERYNRKFRNE